MLCCLMDLLNISVSVNATPKCRDQSQYLFGFIPLSDPVLPDVQAHTDTCTYSLVKRFQKVRDQGKPNFWGARI